MSQSAPGVEGQSAASRAAVQNDASGSKGHDVALFVTCLVDLFRPGIGFASVKLLEDAGCRISVPSAQTCCGQPAFNSGDTDDTRTIAKSVIEIFEVHEFVVAPSGSCAGMIKKHYPALFPVGSDWHRRAEALAAKTYELVTFLVDVLKIERVDAKYKGAITYHDSCSGLRELGIADQPRRLLASVEGLTVNAMKDSDVCCGFGGTFCVKYPEISNAMVEKKVANITDSGAATLLAGDLGCLMNMAGKLSRDGSDVKVRHVAEVLAGMADGPAIGEPEAS